MEVTFRARRWYEGEEACVADETTKAPITDDKPACCILTKGKCKTEFVATSVDMSGKYFAFINVNDDNKQWTPEEPKGEEKKLT
ncbi:MAG: hypothetical protein QMD36_01310 [Candidatus Aenigmarchaeota archaeon]|nr:hypothetical protein [Candidatus Aenigmarchaeota archaeon]